MFQLGPFWIKIINVVNETPCVTLWFFIYFFFNFLFVSFAKRKIVVTCQVSVMTRDNVSATW